MMNALVAVLQTMRRTMRSALRAPGHYLLAAGILGLGLGAAVSIFSAVNAVLVAPLPFPEADRLVEIRSERGGEEALVSMREIMDLREGAGTVFDDVAAYIPGGQYSLSGDAGPEKPPAILMTHNLFAVLGVAPRYGGPWPDLYDRERNFGLVLSEELWQRQFGEDPSVVGGTVALDASPFYSPSYEIYGVMPEGFDFPARTDLYRSLFINPGFPNLEDREARNVVGVARLAPGVDLASARLAVDRVAQDLVRTSPDSNQGVSLIVRPLRESWAAPLRPYLLALFAAAVILLLTACANVANLVLTKVLSRTNELALRAALGAGRARLLGGLAAEGLMLAGIGTVLALVLAAIATGFVDGSVRGLPTWMRFEVDATVTAFAVLAAIATGLAVGLWPARAGLSRDVFGSLREGGRGRTGGARQRSLRGALVAAEVGLSLALLLGSALLGRTFLELGRVDPGLNPERLLTLQVPLPWSYPMEERRAFQEEIVRRVEGIPGVVAAATNANPPMTAVGQPDRVVLEVEGQSESDRVNNPYMNIQRVSPRYFETMEIPITEGRAFDGNIDRDSTVLAAVVSQRLATRLWPGESAVGRRVKRTGPDQPWWEVVGVAGDVLYDGPGGESGFDVYLSSLQAVDGWAYLLVRTQADPAALEDPIKEVIWSWIRASRWWMSNP